MAEDFELWVNGTARVERTEGQCSLLDVLREDLPLRARGRTARWLPRRISSHASRLCMNWSKRARKTH